MCLECPKDSYGLAYARTQSAKLVLAMWCPRCPDNPPRMKADSRVHSGETWEPILVCERCGFGEHLTVAVGGIGEIK